MVGTCLGARDPAVVVIVLPGQDVRGRGGCSGSVGSFCGLGRRRRHLHGGAVGQHGVDGLRFGGVDGQDIFGADLGNSVRMSALVRVRQLLGGVLGGFWWRLTPGGARVRLKRPDVDSGLLSGSAAQKPPSWASDLAKMCSMSVSLVLPGQEAGEGAVDTALGLHDAKFG